MSTCLLDKFLPAKMHNTVSPLIINSHCWPVWFHVSPLFCSPSGLFLNHSVRIKAWLSVTAFLPMICVLLVELSSCRKLLLSGCCRLGFPGILTPTSSENWLLIQTSFLPSLLLFLFFLSSCLTHVLLPVQSELWHYLSLLQFHHLLPP